MRPGTRHPLSPARKVIGEFLRHSQRVPSLATTRRACVAELADARQRGGNAVSWVAIFLKAYALAARRHPRLRCAFIPLPWPHLHEHSQTEAVVPIERFWQGEDVVFGAKVRGPENHSLAQLHAHLRRFKETPVHQISAFRQQLRLGRLPWPWRRFVFWQTLYLSGAKRARRFGTCVVSSMGHLGAEQVHPLTALTTYFSAGPVGPGGDVTLRIIYDHRVMDDGHVARALAAVEEALHTNVLAELKSLAAGQAA
jgi:pyruvate/2-oxoglutarate dehydrogenase complex dihydrolipoamide acyltransferase (E2) component